MVGRYSVINQKSVTGDRYQRKLFLLFYEKLDRKSPATVVGLDATAPNLLMDYVIHKVTRPLLDDTKMSKEAILALVEALAVEGSTTLGVDNDVKDHVVEVVLSDEEYISDDYDREDYWEVSEESSEYYEEEESD